MEEVDGDIEIAVRFDGSGKQGFGQGFIGLQQIDIVAAARIERIPEKPGVDLEEGDMRAGGAGNGNCLAAAGDDFRELGNPHGREGAGGGWCGGLDESGRSPQTSFVPQGGREDRAVGKGHGNCRPDQFKARNETGLTAVSFTFDRGGIDIDGEVEAFSGLKIGEAEGEDVEAVLAVDPVMGLTEGIEAGIGG